MKAEDLMNRLYGERCKDQKEFLDFLSTKLDSFGLFPEDELAQVFAHKVPEGWVKRIQNCQVDQPNYDGRFITG